MSTPDIPPKAPVRPALPVLRLPGMPDGIIGVRICYGGRVQADEFELHGKTITKGGRFAVSAVVVVPAPGFEFVEDEKRPGKYRVQKQGAAPAVEG